MKIIMINICLMLLMLSLVAVRAQGPSACGTNLKQLVVGADFGSGAGADGDLGYEPFEIEKDGNVEGFDQVVACLVAQRIRLQGVVFKQIAFGDLLFDLTEPDSPIDVVISAMSITSDRVAKPNVSFVKYNEDSLGIVFKIADVTPALQNPATVLNAVNQLGSATSPITVATTTNTREVKILSAYPNISVDEEDELQDALNALTSGFAFALFVDGATAVKIAADNPDTLFAVKNVFDSTHTDDSQGLGIAINSQCCQLYANIQQAINDMNADGTLARLRTQFNVPQGFIPVSGLAPACAGTANINSNAIANYLFSKYCICIAPVVDFE